MEPLGKDSGLLAMGALALAIGQWLFREVTARVNRDTSRLERLEAQLEDSNRSIHKALDECREDRDKFRKALAELPCHSCVLALPESAGPTSHGRS